MKTAGWTGSVAVLGVALAMAAPACKDNQGGGGGGAGGQADGEGGASGEGGGAGSSGGQGGGGTGGQAGGGGNPGAGGAAGVACMPKLIGIVRDFTNAHPDFERNTNQPAPLDAGIPDGGTPDAGPMPAPLAIGMVEKKLGTDGKPVYARTGPFRDANGFVQVEGKTTFDQWFRNSPGVNMWQQHEVTWAPLTDTLHSFGSDADFFPIDGLLLGNKDLVTGTPSAMAATADLEHNQLFTFELHGELLYQGGKDEEIIIESDDDSWVFINGNLALDNGGLHGFGYRTLALDSAATALGIEPGKTYPFAIFFADRKLSNAKLRFSSGAKLTNCAAILPSN
jgi:fibro-slime domain-containing protein